MTQGKHDISSRRDIEQLLALFYSEALKDEKIGFFFTDVVKLDLEEHLPRISDFWQSVVFNDISYKADLIQIHRNIDVLSKIEKHHFDQWLYLFKASVDSLFAGSNAQKLINRAQSIATVMQIKLLKSTVK